MSRRLQVTFTDEQYQILANMSEKSGKPLAYIVREAISFYLREEMGLAVATKQLRPGGDTRSGKGGAGE